MAWKGRSETGDEMRGRKSVLSSVTNQIPDIIVWYKPATRPPTHSPFMPPLSATLTQPYLPSPNLYTTLPPTNNCWQKRCLPRLGLIIASRLVTPAYPTPSPSSSSSLLSREGGIFLRLARWTAKWKSKAEDDEVICISDNLEFVRLDYFKVFFKARSF